MAETGLVGLILFLALLGVTLRPLSLERLRRDAQALCAVMLLANAVLNAMTTGDLPGNRVMFLMLGVLALLAVRPVPPRRRSASLPAPLPLSIARGRHAAPSASGEDGAMTE